MKSRTLTIAINAPADRAYAFVSDPANLPKWAAGLAKTVEAKNGAWVVQTPLGPATVRFADKNPFGVADHYVKLPSGPEVYVPMRVLPNAMDAKWCSRFSNFPECRRSALPVTFAWWRPTCKR